MPPVLPAPLLCVLTPELAAAPLSLLEKLSKPGATLRSDVSPEVALKLAADAPPWGVLVAFLPDVMPAPDFLKLVRRQRRDLRCLVVALPQQATPEGLEVWESAGSARHAASRVDHRELWPALSARVMAPPPLHSTAHRAGAIGAAIVGVAALGTVAWVVLAGSPDSGEVHVARRQPAAPDRPAAAPPDARSPVAVEPVRPPDASAAVAVAPVRPPDARAAVAVEPVRPPDAAPRVVVRPEPAAPPPDAAPRVAARPEPPPAPPRPAAAPSGEGGATRLPVRYQSTWRTPVVTDAAALDALLTRARAGGAELRIRCPAAADGKCEPLAIERGKKTAALLKERGVRVTSTTVVPAPDGWGAEIVLR